MRGRQESHREEMGVEQRQNWKKQHSWDSGQQVLYLGCLTKQQLILTSVAIVLIVLLIVVTVTAVTLTQKPKGSLEPTPAFSTGGDMLDFLVQSGAISKPDGLLATWFHRANSKEDMNKALEGHAMVLEADVTLEGYGTPDEKPIPIMAHPPDIYSDNTLDQWLDAVLDSKKGMKLDFKTLESVGFSLDLLSRKNSSKGINRPVWINADILQGPNVPGFVPAVNGTRFLQLIQQMFPDVTVSPGWKVVYAPPVFTGTYTRSMVENMYNMIKDIPQKVTFPVHALLVRSGWQHISWLLSQSPRFSLTLWQGSVHPNISDLLFVRDNAHPARVYYDIYEPTLSELKQIARQQQRLKRFYPGGDLMDYLFPTCSSDNSFLPTAQNDSLAVRWFNVTNMTSLLAQISDAAGGMLVIQVTADSIQPGVPLVGVSGKTSEVLTLQDVLQLLGHDTDARWGVYLRVDNQQLLEASLRLLQSAHSEERLYRPVWIQSSDDTQEFVSTVERLFPYVTLVLNQRHWPPQIPAAVTQLSQRVAINLNGALLNKHEELVSLTGMMDRYDVIVEEDKSNMEVFQVLKGLVAQRTGRANTNLYIISDQS